MSAPVLAQAAATDGKPVHNINLTEPRDIADAAEVSAAISVLVKHAASCPATPLRDRQACACSFTHDLKKLKSAYAVAVGRHPGWAEVGAVVGYRNNANGNSVTLNLPSVKRQLDVCARTRHE